MKRVIKSADSIDTGAHSAVDLRESVYLTVKNALERTLNDLPKVCASSIPEYEERYNDASGTNYAEINRSLSELADNVTYQLLLDCPFRSKYY